MPIIQFPHFALPMPEHTMVTLSPEMQSLPGQAPASRLTFSGQCPVTEIQWNLPVEATSVAIKSGLSRQAVFCVTGLSSLKCTCRTFCWNMWSFKTGDLSWQWFLKTGFTVGVADKSSEGMVLSSQEESWGHTLANLPTLSGFNLKLLMSPPGWTVHS